MNEFEFILEDRIEKIRSINEKYDLEHNAYIAFSGGKDSTILHYLIDIALPDNQIPRVFINTGLEYQAMRKYVQELANNDKRIIVYNNTKNIKATLEKEGYPFKSKKHCNFVHIFQKSGMHYGIQNYLDKDCPNIVKYQFNNDFKLNLSAYCCTAFKKIPVHNWCKENNKTINITGLRKEEGGVRSKINCVLMKGDKIIKFHPLSIISEEWENWFIDKYNIKLCKLYYPPYNFKRTGCKGCPFALQLQKQLDILKELLPNEYKQCEILWKPVYDEYRRIGYRLKKEN